VFELRRTWCKDGSLRMLPTFATMSQVQATHARSMLCEINKTKYLRGETRSFCINRLIVSTIMPDQINSFLCTNKFLSNVVQNCDARRLRYQKLKSRTALEGAHEEREFQTLSGDIDNVPGPSSIATQRQFAKQSRTLSINTGTYDSFL